MFSTPTVPEDPAVQWELETHTALPWARPWLPAWSAENHTQPQCGDWGWRGLAPCGRC